MFEEDIVPVYDEILDFYGPDVTQELVDDGTLPKPRRGRSRARNKNRGSLRHHNHQRFMDIVNERLWPIKAPDGVTEILYEMDSAFTDKQRTVITNALDDLACRSGVVRFRLRRSDEDTKKPWIQLFLDTDVPPFYCWSFVGYQDLLDKQNNPVGQPILMGQAGECASTGGVHHMVLHSLGFWHSPSEPDRDDYYTIVWENILPGLEHNYRKRLNITANTLGLPNDYGTVMGLGPTDNSLNNNFTTLEAPEPFAQFEYASEMDIMRLRLLYQCKSGARTYQDYLLYLCSDDCPCWEGALGSCRSSDSACQGNLVCSKVSDQCVAAATMAENVQKTRHGFTEMLVQMNLLSLNQGDIDDMPPPTPLVAFATLGAVGLVLAKVAHISNRRRSQYEPIR